MYQELCRLLSAKDLNARIALPSWYAYYNGTIYDHNRVDKAIHIRQLRRAKALPFVFINQVPVNLTYAVNIICMNLFGIYMYNVLFKVRIAFPIVKIIFWLLKKYLTTNWQTGYKRHHH